MKKSLKCISAFIALFLFAAAAFAVTQEEARREIFAYAFRLDEPCRFQRFDAIIYDVDARRLEAF